MMSTLLEKLKTKPNDHQRSTIEGIEGTPTGGKDRTGEKTQAQENSGSPD